MRVTDALGSLGEPLHVSADVEEVAFGVGEGGDGAVVLSAAGAEFGGSEGDDAVYLRRGENCRWQEYLRGRSIQRATFEG
jgi:hypothetical protein